MEPDRKDPSAVTIERERKIDLESLPDDFALLKEMVRELASANERLQRRIEYLERMQFGRKSEKINPDQLQLAFPGFPIPPEGPIPALEPLPAALARPTSPQRSGGHGRKLLPENLARERVVHTLPESELACTCCGELKKEIAREISEQLDWVEPHFVVKQHIRLKYACARKCDSGIDVAPKPLQPIDKGLPGPGLLAATITWKYCDHLPLYRQEKIFARSGIEIARSTLCDWTEAMADLLSPLYWMMKAIVLESRKINADDTVVPVLVEKKGETKQGRLWVYIGDLEHPVVVFEYTPDRKSEGPVSFLADYKGRYLQADAYPGFDTIFASGEIVEVACWAHARRKYFDAQGSDRVRALTAIGFIRKLYEVEERGKSLGKEERETLRRDESSKILNSLKQWIDTEIGKLLPKSPMAQAMQYTLNLWTALGRYVEDGDLEIDNNQAERALRHVVTGRKNWLFAGSDDGGRRAAVLYSLVFTCKRHGVEPYAYFRDVIERMPTCPKDRIADLLPHRWKATQKAETTA